MGNCCTTKAKSGAFRQELDAPLLDDIMKNVPPSTQIVIIRLQSLRDIPIGNSFTSLTDAFVEMKLSPNDAVAGNQKQLSSIKPGSLSPKWEPPEKFQFIVSKIKDSKIILSVYHYNQAKPKESDPLGDAILKLDGLGLSANPIAKTLKFINPKDGKPKGEVEIMISTMTIAESNNIQEHTVYEFQRWQPVLDWGHTGPPGHFLPTDPGRWCNEDGSKFDKEIEYVSPPIPDGFIVTESWNIVSTEKDPDGWQYSINFNSPYWYPENNSTSYVVRRRTWHREIRKNTPAIANIIGTTNPLNTTRNPSTSSNASNSGSSGVASGRRKPMFSKDNTNNNK